MLIESALLDTCCKLYLHCEIIHDVSTRAVSGFMVTETSFMLCNCGA